LIGLLGICLAVGAQPPTAAQQAAPVVPPPPAPAQASPFDPAVQLLANARQKFATVTDYTCTLVKQERIRGQMPPENVIAMKVRNQPYSVYMYWHAPKNFAGQEVCYVAGRNNGMMRVHSAGLLKMAGWVSVDPADPRAQQHSRHRIDEGGIGNLI